MRKVGVLALCALFVGALVSPARAGDTTCTTLISGTHDNVVVPPGATCMIDNATIKGSVKALQDSHLYIEDSTVGGNIDGDKADIVDVRRNTIHGSVQIKEGGPTPVAMQPEAAVCGNTLTQGNIQIEKMTTTRGILVGSVSADQNCPGNVLSKGNIKVEENITGTLAQGLFRVQRNTVGTGGDGGNVQVFKNTGPAEKFVSQNTVGKGTIQCKENTDPFIGGPNTGSAKAEGQCFV